MKSKIDLPNLQEWLRSVGFKAIDVSYIQPTSVDTGIIRLSVVGINDQEMPKDMQDGIEDLFPLTNNGLTYFFTYGYYGIEFYTPKDSTTWFNTGSTWTMRIDPDGKGKLYEPIDEAVPTYAPEFVLHSSESHDASAEQIQGEPSFMMHSDWREPYMAFNDVKAGDRFAARKNLDYDDGLIIPKGTIAIVTGVHVDRGPSQIGDALLTYFTYVMPSVTDKPFKCAKSFWEYPFVQGFDKIEPIPTYTPAFLLHADNDINFVTYQYRSLKIDLDKMYQHLGQWNCELRGVMVDNESKEIEFSIYAPEGSDETQTAYIQDMALSQMPLEITDIRFAKDSQENVITYDLRDAYDLSDIKLTIDYNKYNWHCAGFLTKSFYVQDYIRPIPKYAKEFVLSAEGDIEGWYTDSEKDKYTTDPVLNKLLDDAGIEERSVSYYGQSDDGSLIAYLFRSKDHWLLHEIKRNDAEHFIDVANRYYDGRFIVKPFCIDYDWRPVDCDDEGRTGKYYEGITIEEVNKIPEYAPNFVLHAKDEFNFYRWITKEKAEIDLQKLQDWYYGIGWKIVEVSYIDDKNDSYKRLRVTSVPFDKSDYQGNVTRLFRIGKAFPFLTSRGPIKGHVEDSVTYTWSPVVVIKDLVFKTQNKWQSRGIYDDGKLIGQRLSPVDEIIPDYAPEFVFESSDDEIDKMYEISGIVLSVYRMVKANSKHKDVDRSALFSSRILPFRVERRLDGTYWVQDSRGTPSVEIPTYAPEFVLSAGKLIKVTSFSKDAEKDSWEEGVYGPCSDIFYETNLGLVDMENIDDVLLELSGWGPSSDRMDWFIFEDGRITMNRTEDSNGNEPSDADMAMWKEGDIDLWLADYNVRLEFSDDGGDTYYVPDMFEMKRVLDIPLCDGSFVRSEIPKSAKEFVLHSVNPDEGVYWERISPFDLKIGDEIKTDQLHGQFIDYHTITDIGYCETMSGGQVIDRYPCKLWFGASHFDISKYADYMKPDSTHKFFIKREGVHGYAKEFKLSSGVLVTPADIKFGDLLLGTIKKRAPGGKDSDVWIKVIRGREGFGIRMGHIQFLWQCRLAYD